MNKIWKFADITVRADFTHPYLAKQCREYESQDSALSIAVTSADIAFERIQNEGGYPHTDGYLESLAFERKFAEAVPNLGVLLMHGSAISFKGKGYIFTAPSGTGKSTHSHICKEVYGDQVSYINDDKPLLRCVNGVWYVYGTPWDGQHHLSENVCVPLGGICHIKQGEKNSIKKVGAFDALHILMEQVYRPNDAEKMKEVTSLMSSLCKIPFWQLECNISNEAAILSLGTMSK